MGETLVLFTDRLDDGEQPSLTAEELCTELPPDPRSQEQVATRFPRPAKRERNNRRKTTRPT